MLNKDIKIQIPKWVKYIIDSLNEFEYEAYIVGGCVRDSLLKRTPKDYDITTNAKPEDVIEIFESLGFKVIPTGLKHGTVTVLLDNTGYEVTTYRIDGEYSDNRHPDKVEFTSNLKDDLSRRDFTINAMAYNDKVGLVDYFKGLTDLNNKIIKCVGNPQDRYKEDGLRMLRALRFSAQLGFDLDITTYNDIYELRHLIENISWERIRDEFCKILVTNNTRKALVDLWYLGLLYRIIPELDKCVFFKQHNKHHNSDVFGHTLTVVENTQPNLTLRLSALLHDVGKPKCFTMDEEGQGHFYEHHKESAKLSKEILTRLKFDNKTIDTVCKLVLAHMDRYDFIRTSNIKKFINRVGVENLNNLFELQIADIKGASPRYQDFSNVINLKLECEKILSEKQPLTIKDLDINGYDLMELGVKQGKEIGAILNKLFEIVLDNPEMNNNDKLLNIAKNEMLAN